MAAGRRLTSRQRRADNSSSEGQVPARQAPRPQRKRPTVSLQRCFVMQPTFARTLCAAVALILFATAIHASDESLETLLAYLKSPNVSTRRDAARKLGERRERNQLAVEALAVSA